MGVDEKTLKDSMIRSMYREYAKQYNSGNPNLIDRYNRRERELEKERDNYRNRYQELMRIGYAKYGPGWYKESDPIE